MKIQNLKIPIKSIGRPVMIDIYFKLDLLRNSLHFRTYQIERASVTPGITYKFAGGAKGGVLDRNHGT